MGRKSLYAREDMTAAALRLMADHGPKGVTVAAVAREIGAPTGSIYHRYRSRDELVAELWMDVVEGFQAVFVQSLARAADIEGAVETASLMASWTRSHTMEARLLLLHRRQDFVPGEWPGTLVERAAALEPELGAALRDFALRAFGSSSRHVMARLRFALLDAPFGAIKPYLQARKKVPPVVDELVGLTARAVLGSIPVKGGGR